MVANVKVSSNTLSITLKKVPLTALVLKPLDANVTDDTPLLGNVGLVRSNVIVVSELLGTD